MEIIPIEPYATSSDGGREGGWPKTSRKILMTEGPWRMKRLGSRKMTLRKIDLNQEMDQRETEAMPSEYWREDPVWDSWPFHCSLRDRNALPQYSMDEQDSVQLISPASEDSLHRNYHCHRVGEDGDDAVDNVSVHDIDLPGKSEGVGRDCVSEGEEERDPKSCSRGKKSIPTAHQWTGRGQDGILERMDETDSAGLTHEKEG
jgi:hypothetical protein